MTRAEKFQQATQTIIELLKEGAIKEEVTGYQAGGIRITSIGQIYVGDRLAVVKTEAEFIADRTAYLLKEITYLEGIVTSNNERLHKLQSELSTLQSGQE